MSDRVFAVLCILLGALALGGMSAWAVLGQPGGQVDPFAQLGEPREVWAHDQIVFGDGQVLAVSDVFAGIDNKDWPDFARRVVKSGGRFERVECEMWQREGRVQLSRCQPSPIHWGDAVTSDFAIEA